MKASFLREHSHGKGNMKVLKAIIDRWSLLPLVTVAFFLTSCLERSSDHEHQSQNDSVGETVYITLTSSESRKIGRYLGTYADVDGVILKYKRFDGVGIEEQIELQLIPSSYGGATTTMQWNGALNNVIAGARYNFKAEAYRSGTECLNQIFDEATGSFASNPSFVGWTTYNNFCEDLRDAEPVWGPSNSQNERFKANIFVGEKEYHKLEAGQNDLQLRMAPILKPAAEEQMIPYISKINRPAGYGAGDNVTLEVEFKGPQGFIIGLTGKVSGTCSSDSNEECVEVNEFVIANDWSGGDVEMRLCPDSDSADYWWEVQCGFDNTTITASREISYTIPQNPPPELRFEFIVNLKNTIKTESGWTDVRGDLGLSNTIWFDMYRNTMAQTSELIFMPTVQDISVYFDMSSDTADLSYALLTQGVTNDIEIFANLEYTEKTPLGFPSPYLKLVNTGSSTGTQTLYGRMDKNELYQAVLNLNFVHTPSGFDFVSGYPLPAFNKPKYGNPNENWETFKNTSQCEHCQFLVVNEYYDGAARVAGHENSPFYYMDLYPTDIGELICGERSGYQDCARYYTEWNTEEDPWKLNDPSIDGGSLAYANLGGNTNNYSNNMFDGSISYLRLKNTNFLGTNLTGFKFNYMDLDSSQFVNSQINKTVFRRSSLDNVLFTSNDGLETTQNLPYTDLKFDMSRGDGVIIEDLTTKMNVNSTSFSNMQFSNNLIYQSEFNGLTVTGQFKNNDVVESSIQNSQFEGVDFSGTSFISTSIALSSLVGANLSTTWFDLASGTDFYLVDCDDSTILPIYNNVACRNNYLEFTEESDREFVMTLPNDKNRASYLYAGDADSFRLDVQNPASVAVEVTSKSSDIQFSLRKSGSADIIVPTKGDSRVVERDDGTYTTRWSYFAEFPTLEDDQYYYVQVNAAEGIFYIISYYQEQ